VAGLDKQAKVLTEGQIKAALGAVAARRYADQSANHYFHFKSPPKSLLKGRKPSRRLETQVTPPGVRSGCCC
jgi:hypothetical protein